jgi:hypothetical protein
MTNSLVSSNNEEYIENFNSEFDLKQLDSIPLYSVLLLVPKIKVSNSKLESILYDNLPLLNQVV